MAHTALRDDEKREYFDPPDVLEKKVDKLVQWIRDSKHMITFTVKEYINIYILFIILVYLLCRELE